MCYEFSDWTWKARAAELARRQREAETASRKESKPSAPPEQAPREPRVAEQEKVPA